MLLAGLLSNERYSGDCDQIDGAPAALPQAFARGLKREPGGLDLLGGGVGDFATSEGDLEVLDGEVIVALLELVFTGVLASEGDIASEVVSGFALGEHHVVEGIAETTLPLVRGGGPDQVRDSGPVIPRVAGDLQRERMVGHRLVEAHQHPREATEQAEDLQTPGWRNRPQ